jgi:uncharacterized protein (TIGR02231 family)
VLRHKRSATALPSHELEELEKAAQQAQQEHKRLLQALDRVQRKRQRSSAWLDLWSRALPRAPQPSPQNLEDWKAAIEKIEAQMTEALDRTSELGRALQQAKRAEKQANLRLEAGKRVSPDYRAALEVQIESPADQTIEIEARYRTACALWRPEHLARLQTTPEGELEVEVQTVATAWQATGEVWEGVRCKFSTARPAHAASPPLLSEDLLVSRRKTEQERKYVRVEQRDEQVATVGIDRGTRQVEEMPGLDDGGEPVSFEPEGPCSIASDGHPFRVELSSRKLPCKLDRIAYPELGEAIHFRMTSTWDGKMPLLAGPVWIARQGAMIGRSKTSFVGQGEPFELGMGVDDGLRVRRTVEEKRDTTLVMGKQRITRTIKVFLRNLSDSERALRVVERYPVSEIEDVNVELVSYREGKPEPRDGFVHFDVTVPGHGTKELVLEVRIEASSRVVM